METYSCFSRKKTILFFMLIFVILTTGAIFEVHCMDEEYQSNNEYQRNEEYNTYINELMDKSYKEYVQLIKQYDGKEISGSGEDNKNCINIMDEEYQQNNEYQPDKEYNVKDISGSEENNKSSIQFSCPICFNNKLNQKDYVLSFALTGKLQEDFKNINNTLLIHIKNQHNYYYTDFKNSKKIIKNYTHECFNQFWKKEYARFGFCLICGKAFVSLKNHYKSNNCQCNYTYLETGKLIPANLMLYFGTQSNKYNGIGIFIYDSKSCIIFNPNDCNLEEIPLPKKRGKK